MSSITLGIVYFNVVMYATCYQLQRPLEPFMVEKLIGHNGDAATEYGNLQSFFYVFQFFGALIAGFFLDKFGYKVGFILTFGASALSYYFLSLATDSISMLYLSKIPSMFQHGFLIAQMTIAVIAVDASDRAVALGRLTTCYAVGTVVGPSLGGILGSSGDYIFGAQLAVVGSLVSIVLTLFLPNISKDKKTVQSESTKVDTVYVDNKQDSIVAKVLAVLAVVWLLLSTKVITSVANSMSATVFPLIMKNTYSFDEKSLGFTMSAMSALNAVVGAVFVNPVISYLGGDLVKVIRFSLWGMLLCAIIQGFMSVGGFVHVMGTLTGNVLSESTMSLSLYLFSAFVASSFQYLLSTMSTAESTSRVNAQSKGTLLGIEHSLFAAARVSSPQAGIALLNYNISSSWMNGRASVAFVGAGIYGLVLILWHFAHHSLKRTDNNVGGGGRNLKEEKED